MPPRRQGGELVAQADAKQGDLSQELLNLRNLFVEWMKGGER